MSVTGQRMRTLIILRVTHMRMRMLVPRIQLSYARLCLCVGVASAFLDLSAAALRFAKSASSQAACRMQGSRLISAAPVAILSPTASSASAARTRCSTSRA